MKTETLDALCHVNPELIGNGTPRSFTFEYVDISSVTLGSIDWTQVSRHTTGTAPSRARRVTRDGDVLLCTVRPGLKAHARIQGRGERPTVVSTAFAVLRPKCLSDSSFVFHQLFSTSVSSQLRACEVGSNYPAVNECDVRRIRVYCPNSAERASIGGVLDLLDAAIEKTAAVIVKLKQVRAGLLHDLLTRGLDDEGELRNPLRRPEQFESSPLGQVPKAWDSPSLTTLCEYIGSGITPRGGQDVYTSEGALFIRSQNVMFEGLRLDDVAFIPERIHMIMQRSEVFAHDVLFNITGASIGRCCVMPAGLGKTNVNQHVCILRVPGAEEAEAVFLSAVLGSDIGQRQLDALNTCGNRQGINYQQLGAFVIPWPGSSERSEIAKRLTAIAIRIEAEAGEQSKLSQLKAGLMSDLLTGRVPVPEKIEIGVAS